MVRVSRLLSDCAQSCRGWFRSFARPNRRRGRSAVTPESLEPRMLLAGMQVGMNLDWVRDWSSAWTFTDAMQSSRPWVSHSYNTVTRVNDWAGGANIPVLTDAHGWPTRLQTWTNAQGQAMQQRLGTLMFDSLNGAYPAGTYRAEWEGNGVITWGADAVAIQTGRTADGKNFALLNVTPTNGGIYLRIDQVDPANPLRNMHVWMPSYNGQSFAGQTWTPGAGFSPFHPLFTQRLDAFDTLRFKDWQDTDISDIQTWADRAEVGDARQFSTGLVAGVAPEYMIALSNQIHSNPWFSMPHMGDDTFVRNFAALVRDTLDPTLKVYVEWSNEVWNGAPGFEGNQWVRQQLALPQNQGLTFEQLVARETQRDFDIWSQVFAGQEQRLVRTVGGFAANAWFTEQVLRNMNGRFDAIAIAPYFGPTAAQRATYTASTTVADVLRDTRANLPTALGFIDTHQAMADRYSAQLGRDIKLVAYEGGAHLDGRNAPYQAAFNEASLRPEMYDIYTAFLDGADARGLDLYVNFKYSDRQINSPWGIMGVLTRQDQPLSEAHRYRALVDWIAAHQGQPQLSTIGIAATDATASEAGSDTATFTLTRAGGSLLQPLTVGYTIGGTATQGTDYATLPGQVTFAAGSTTATITIIPRNDTLVERPETVVLTLVDTGRYLLGAANATATIASDDLSSVYVQVTDGAASETNRDPGQIVVRRTNPDFTQALTVRYQVTGTATSGQDFDALSGTLTIAAGQTEAAIVVRPIDDALVEPSENAIVTLLSSPDYTLSSAIRGTIYIADNDVTASTPTVTVSAIDATAAEAGNDPGAFRITRTGSLTQSLTVDYTLSGTAANGSDYVTLSGRAIIAAGASSATITVQPINDTAVENPETVVLTLSAGTAYRLGSPASATVTLASDDSPSPGANVLPVLMVIANRDFYYQEYADTRASLEAAGIRVVVAAATRDIAIPHANSGQGTSTGYVQPDVTLFEADASRYSTIVFVGGWGSSQYQFSFTGTYQNGQYNGSTALHETVNNLINAFVQQNKYVTAICHGVSVLAWARVNGHSLLEGRRVTGWNGTAPPSNTNLTTTRAQITANGATMVASGSIGNTSTQTDDVLIDGRIITAENFNSARVFGQVIAQRLLS